MKNIAYKTICYLAESLLIIIFLNIPAWGKPRESYHIDPEYDRKLETVLFSMDVNSNNLSIYKDILKKLPKYTEVIILLPKDSEAVIEGEIRKMKLQARTKLVTFDISSVENAEVYLLFPENSKVYSAPISKMSIPRGSVWAQDLFKPARTEDGKDIIIVPDTYMMFLTTSAGDKRNLISDNIFVDSLSSTGLNIKKLPITFKGGNFMIDKRKDKTIAFVGGDVIKETKNVLKEMAGTHEPSDGDIIEMLKDDFNADEVVVIGMERQQPSRMFHLDQAMVFLSDGVVGVTSIAYDNEKIFNMKEIKDVNRFLSELREKLRGLGYQIIDMETTADDILHYRYYVNGIPYRNAKTGKKEFLMPVFDEVKTSRDYNILNRNIIVMESLGYKVITVPTHANKHQGGIHCLVNVMN